MPISAENVCRGTPIQSAQALNSRVSSSSVSPTSNTTDLITRYYSAFNAHDWDGMLALLDEGVRRDVNEGASRGGKARFKDFLAHMDRCYDERLEDIVVMTSADSATKRKSVKSAEMGRRST